MTHTVKLNSRCSKHYTILSDGHHLQVDFITLKRPECSRTVGMEVNRHRTSNIAQPFALEPTIAFAFDSYTLVFEK